MMISKLMLSISLLLLMMMLLMMMMISKLMLSISLLLLMMMLLMMAMMMISKLMLSISSLSLAKSSSSSSHLQYHHVLYHLNSHIISLNFTQLRLYHHIYSLSPSSTDSSSGGGYHAPITPSRFMATRVNWADVINESKATEDQRVSISLLYHFNRHSSCKLSTQWRILDANLMISMICVFTLYHDYPHH
jgi:hypothetical protein